MKLTWGEVFTRQYSIATKLHTQTRECVRATIDPPTPISHSNDVKNISSHPTPYMRERAQYLCSDFFDRLRVISFQKISLLHAVS
jgi:hypothetical protein